MPISISATWSPSGIRGAGTAHRPHRHVNSERRADTPTILHFTRWRWRPRPISRRKVRRRGSPQCTEGGRRRETPPMREAQPPVGVEAGMRALLARRSAELEGGATAVGWKIGFNTPAIQAHFGISGAVVGYLTDTTVMDAGAPIDLSGWQRPALEVEVAIRVGDNGGIGALGPALELVDLNLPFDRLEPILAGNVF